MSEASPAAPAATAGPVQTAITPPAGSVLAGGGAPAADARAWLPEEFRSDPTFKDLADVASLAKGYKHAASLVGIDKADVIRLPREGDIPPEVWGRLGRPEKPDGYELKGPQNLAPEVSGAFAETAHKLGLTKAQAAGIMDFYTKGIEGSAAAQEAAQGEKLQAGLAKVKEAWGAAYNDRAAAVVQLVTQKAGEDNLGVLDQLIAEGKLPVLNLLADAASVMLERSALKGGGAANGGGAMTPEAAKARRDELMRDSGFVAKLQNRDAEGHADAERLWDELHEWAYGNTPRAA